ncbi:acetylornithine aminotransferase [Bacillus pakistanensis]|uniref:Acetylornithine aminotransferase n=1 Tax=Rossellomorea pakistanensis TaxID=992288 RepID=A0ABS2N8A8_9BACI|nr:acetylornithine transaminase [Bacillus pakistanensis]MBM7584010.1 acetylornithine aminotransferase [Bacillus pakistanensis]
MSNSIMIDDKALNPLMTTYNRFPITVIKGEGSYVWDEEGERYLDFTSGIATCNLGHVPHYVKDQIEEQLNTLWHCSNLYHIPSQEKLASLLVEQSCGDKVFFCNSGAEANEAAIKLARRYAQKVKNTDSFEVVTFRDSFHGRTLATLTATGQEKIQKGFLPLLEGFRYLPYNDIAALDELAGEKTCAVLLELVQGEGGVIPAQQEWIEKLSDICLEKGLLLMVDEIQTGLGRTGSLFAYQQYGMEPDVVTLAKGLGSGFPIGAVLAKENVAKAFEPGSHGTTFGGNPLSTTAGVATLTYIKENNIAEKAGELGEYLQEQLAKLAEKYSVIKEVRGKGLLSGLVIPNAVEVVHAARDKKLLVLIAGPNVLRILPPLTTTKQEIDDCISILGNILNEYHI